MIENIHRSLEGRRHLRVHPPPSGPRAGELPVATVAAVRSAAGSGRRGMTFRLEAAGLAVDIDVDDDAIRRVLEETFIDLRVDASSARADATLELRSCDTPFRHWTLAATDGRPPRRLLDGQLIAREVLDRIDELVVHERGPVIGGCAVDTPFGRLLLGGVNATSIAAHWTDTTPDVEIVAHGVVSIAGVRVQSYRRPMTWDDAVHARRGTVGLGRIPLVPLRTFSGRDTSCSAPGDVRAVLVPSDRDGSARNPEPADAFAALAGTDGMLTRAGGPTFAALADLVRRVPVATVSATAAFDWSPELVEWAVGAS